MQFAFFYHSLISGWNHGNAHFLRGVATELLARGHDVRIFEPRDGWSIANLVDDHGPEAIAAFERAFPRLDSHRYDPARLDLERALDGVDVALVHEWNPPELVEAIGRCRARTGEFRAFFHDTHHRAVTDRESIAGVDLSGYDGVLAFGESLRQRYLEEGWERQVWTWHEAADTRVFRPLEAEEPTGDLVWIGNWGDGERDRRLRRYLVEPADRLELRTTVHGVRYPDPLVGEFDRRGIDYRGWVPNYRVPEVFAAHRMTLHVPRAPYLEALAGVPTIRVFEALACGVPLICAPWRDVEGLFTPGEDYLVADDPEQMADHLRAVRHDDRLAERLAEQGRHTILARHTCAHRVDQLLEICRATDLSAAGAPDRLERRSSSPASLEE